MLRIERSIAAALALLQQMANSTRAQKGKSAENKTGSASPLRGGG
jgi:hypothetical protein